VRKVCIDDFALKRRFRYGTIMIDIDSRRVIDIFESREPGDVAEWLSSYPDIEVVSRDGSVQYAAAIKSAHPKALQVSDRFHLIKNLTDSAKEHMTRIVGQHFRISGGGNDVYKGGYWEAAEGSKPDLPERRHIATVHKKKNVIREVHELAGFGFNVAKIAGMLGIAHSTAKKYLKKDFIPENKGYGSKQPSRLKPYVDTINAMLGKGCKFKEIECAIRKMGYSGAASTIRMYATRQRRLLQSLSSRRIGKTEIIERKWLTKLLYQPMEKVKGITEDQIGRVINEYPIIGAIYDVVRSFKEVVFSKNVQGIDTWIEAAAHLGIDEINSFINGIKRDIEAVKNAIRFDYSNGLAEGKINKLKLAKRIMYGRNSFSLLRNKLLIRESLYVN